YAGARSRRVRRDRPLHDPWKRHALQATADAHGVYHLGSAQPVDRVFADHHGEATRAALWHIAVPSFSLDLSGVTLTAYVSAADTVTVVEGNLTGGGVNLASGSLRVRVIKQ